LGRSYTFFSDADAITHKQGRDYTTMIKYFEHFGDTDLWCKQYCDSLKVRQKIDEDKIHKLVETSEASDDGNLETTMEKNEVIESPKVEMDLTKSEPTNDCAEEENVDNSVKI
jgi:hypothetical protein